MMRVSLLSYELRLHDGPRLLEARHTALQPREEGLEYRCRRVPELCARILLLRLRVGRPLAAAAAVLRVVLRYL